MSQLNQKVLYPTRVTMLDSVTLDNEVFNILRSQLHIALQMIPPWLLTEYEAKLDVILQYIIWKLSVSKFHGTFGQQLLNVKYNEIELSEKKRYFLLVSRIITYLHTSNFFSFPSAGANEAVRHVDIILRVLNLANLLWFCCEGKYPTLTDRMLGLRPVCISNKPRSIGYNYMTRELLWHGFIELLTFTLSMVNYQYLRSKILRLFSSYKKGHISRGKLQVNVNMKCAICRKSPVIPQHMGCSHVYCYYCIQANRLVDSNFDCPACGHFEADVHFVNH